MKKQPWLPDYPSLAVTMAVKALAAGNANEEQQKRALKWIIEDLCKTYDWAFNPTDRDTCVMLGMQLVGKQIVHEINLSPAKLKGQKEHG